MVYTGETVSGNGFHSALQQDGVYSTEYELVGPHSSCNNTLLEFDNPLYSDRGPVTFTEKELVSLTYCFCFTFNVLPRGNSIDMIYTTFPCLFICVLQTECEASTTSTVYTYVPTTVSLSSVLAYNNNSLLSRSNVGDCS